ncbi:hypothetical protein OG271_12885 [Micromonospora rifamycinica]|uniref:hypothetical protein n=1 Tax=Micromonospora rifamycinica TaxID=291594 RepID=UPI002E27C681|nr:hypothetical protein [Micromonospora rifamycinica]
MARHAKEAAYPGLLARCWRRFRRRRVDPLDRLRPMTNHAERLAAYRVMGVASVPHLPQRPLLPERPHLPERPLLTLAGEYRAGCWS